MKGLFKKRLLAILLGFLVLAGTGEAQPNKRYVKNPEKDLFGKSLNKKNVKVKESRSVVKAKKKQAKAAEKTDRQYASYVKKSRERAVKIQSPEVRERMKKNRKEADDNYATKKKRINHDSKKAAKKYGK